MAVYSPIWYSHHQILKGEVLSEDDLAFRPKSSSSFVRSKRSTTSQIPSPVGETGPDRLGLKFLLKNISNAKDVSPQESQKNQTTSTNQSSIFLSLEELTLNPPEGSLRCPSQYMIPIYDRVVLQKNNSFEERRIPRRIHVSFNQRCVPDELAYSIQKWKDALPDHSFYFHDDDAVDRLLQQAYWDTQFPELHRVMQCVKYKGAMKIDVWRILIIYLFGGLYTDVDVTPGPWFNTSTIHSNDTFFTLSDADDRPSQWLFAMSPRHPIAEFTMDEIQRRLLKMKNIAKPRVVHITGPQALKAGRNKFEHLKNQGLHGYDTMDTTKVSKIDTPHYILSRMDEMVEFQGSNMTVRNKTEQLSGILHWPDQVKQSKTINYEGMSCQHYLAMLERPKS
ncbi:glycosyltransferase sugar-binding protein containing DXD motif [Nitzschia inconspicua]|uniref:Glycosyltransferase sugar-binding protein containing DXD motif n=1 Tax=Nitzschia inconspicua TaxID=303405 RepID=A0A9K3KYM6_9STRA|nr:glycosyltransferase sugar-binding protein containing DXD motif [Nitzschia inconspicua]